MKKTFIIILSLIYITVLDTSFIFAQIQDTTPPNLLTFDFNPKTVDVSQSFATVQFTATARDDLSNIQNNSNFGFRSSTGQNFTGSLEVQPFLNGYYPAGSIDL